MDDILEHFGVKGMKWGIRKERSTSDGQSNRSRNAKRIAAGLGIAAAVGGSIFIANRGLRMSSLSKSSKKAGSKYATAFLANKSNAKMKANIARETRQKAINDIYKKNRVILNDMEKRYSQSQKEISSYWAQESSRLGVNLLWDR